MKHETKMKIAPSRSHQRIVVLHDRRTRASHRVTASICYDATDLRIASDLREYTDAWIVPALNQDVPTFDNMVSALHYHMYQHIILVNNGEYGGTVAQAPYREHFHKNIAAVHGIEQLTVTFAEVDLAAFNSDLSGLALDAASPASRGQSMRVKYPPAGWRGRT
jgi:hypothetical protein